MVADGVHILISLSLVLAILRARRPEPYLVAALAAAFPDIDLYVLHPLVQLGYVEGAIWLHRGLTHSIFGGIVFIVVLSFIGPWRAAAVGFFSHVFFDVLTGGVRLFAPFDSAMYGLSLSWLLVNMVTAAVSVVVILGGLFYMNSGFERPELSTPYSELFLDQFK